MVWAVVAVLLLFPITVAVKVGPVGLWHLGPVLSTMMLPAPKLAMWNGLALTGWKPRLA